jgi:hypothetical protein
VGWWWYEIKRDVWENLEMVSLYRVLLAYIIIINGLGLGFVFQVARGLVLAVRLWCGVEKLESCWFQDFLARGKIAVVTVIIAD